MAYQDGFTYVKGPIKYVWSDMSSTCTVLARNPVTLGLGHTVVEAADSDVTSFFGIAAHDAADSLGGVLAGKMLVEVPQAETIYALKCGTAGTASEFSAGQSIDLEKVANYTIGNEDSQATPVVTIVPRDDGSTIDSADSTVFVHFLGNKLGVFGSNASVSVFYV
jgi:hypothetical protein